MPDQRDNFEPTPGELGEPAAATLRRIADVQREQQHIAAKVGELCVGLQGDRKGTVRGLFERVNDIEDWISSRRWVERSIVGALIVIILGGFVVVGQFVVEEKAKAHDRAIRPTKMEVIQ